jgi:hypothetical protein
MLCSPLTTVSTQFFIPSSLGPADPARADGQGAPQLRGCLPHRDRRTEEEKVPQGNHAHDPAAAGRGQGHDQRVLGRLAAKLTQAALLHHRLVLLELEDLLTLEARA